MPDTEDVVVMLPDDPPELTPTGWRTLLAVLVQHDEMEHGPEWRSQLSEAGE